MFRQVMGRWLSLVNSPGFGINVVFPSQNHAGYSSSYSEITRNDEITPSCNAWARFHQKLAIRSSPGALQFFFCTKTFTTSHVTRPQVSIVRKSLGWLSVRQKLRSNTATMVHKCRINQALPYLCNLFHDRFSVSGHSTRNKSLLNLPKCRLSTGQCSLVFRRAKEYNLLPEYIRVTNNILSDRQVMQPFRASVSFP